MNVGDIKITYSRRRSIMLQVLPDASVELRAPLNTPTRFIDEFINKNREWIDKRKKIVKLNKPPKKNLAHGETIVFLGKEYLLDMGDYKKIEIKGNLLLFPRALQFRAKKELENWYIKQAKEIINFQVEHYAKEMKTSYTSIVFSDTRSKWGSCTHDNRLQFNWRLVMTPLLVLRYVVIHELAHTTIKNHTYNFWNRVKAFNPSYKQQIKWLKENGNGLTV